VQEEGDSFGSQGQNLTHIEKRNNCGHVYFEETGHVAGDSYD